MALGGFAFSRAVGFTAFLVMISVLGIVPAGHGERASAQSMVTVSTAADLENAVANASAGDTILVEPGTYQLTDRLALAKSGIMLQGLGVRAADVELVAANNKRVILVSSPATSVTVRNLTIKGGKINKGSGGGVLVEAGAQLSLIEVEVVDNFAEQGGGLSNAGTTTVMRSLFDGNDARGKGGGIETSGQLTVVNSTLTDNEGKGGGGLAASGVANLSFVTIFGNRSTNAIGAGSLRIGGTLFI